jgi:hypothetical protein
MQLPQWQQIRHVQVMPSLVVAIIFCALGFIAFAVSFVATI